MNNIDRTDFEKWVEIYEIKKLNCDFVRNDENTHLCVYKGKRRYKLVLSILHAFPSTYFSKKVGEILNEMQKDAQLSDVVDIFTSTSLGPTKRNEIEDVAIRNDFSVRIIDIDDMQAVKEIAEILSPKQEKNNDIYEKMMFDYLSKANSSSFIKNGLFYSVILFLIYKNGEISKSDLQSNIKIYLGTTNDNLDNSLDYLRSFKPGKIVSTYKFNETYYCLAEDERHIFEESEKESKNLEAEFKNTFSTISNKYFITDVDKAYKLFVQYYMSVGNNIIKIGENSKENKDAYEFFKFGLIPLMPNAEQITEFLSDLNDECGQNNFLNRMCLGKSFLNLYKSQTYQNYISNKKNHIVLDTTLAIHYLCNKYDLKGLNAKYEDSDFLAVERLINYKDNNQGKISFLIPFDYAGEIIGELKKAIKLADFEGVGNIAIPVQTSNIFYNFYLFVKEAKKNANISTIYKFEDFAKELGFERVCLSDEDFFMQNMICLKNFFKYTDCVFVDKVTERYDCFDHLIRTYSAYLFSERYYEKSAKAIESDVRQAIYFAKKSKEDNMVDFYLSSWDTSLYDLRDMVNNELMLTKSYAIHRPGALLNRLMLKDFKVNDKFLTNEIMVYADRTYELSDKIKSMFDKVILPFFMASENKNSTLVQEILKLQKEYIDQKNEGQRSSREKVLPIEDIFIKIRDKMHQKACTTRDLACYLADEENHNFVIELISKALDSYKKGLKLDISSEICDSLICYLDKKDGEEVEI